MRFVVRAVRDRAGAHAAMRAELPANAEWVYDTTRNAMDTFFAALDLVGSSAAVHMEDDIILASNFEPRIMQAIAASPSSVIQFFSMRKADRTIGTRLDRNFLMGQCFYLPPNYSAEVRAYHAGWKDRLRHPTGLDLLVGDFLRSRREQYWIVCPNLVDHVVGVSVIDARRSSKRQSKTFVK